MQKKKKKVNLIFWQKSGRTSYQVVGSVLDQHPMCFEDALHVFKMEKRTSKAEPIFVLFERENEPAYNFLNKSHIISHCHRIASHRTLKPWWKSF